MKLPEIFMQESGPKGRHFPVGSPGPPAPRASRQKPRFFLVLATEVLVTMLDDHTDAKTNYKTITVIMKV